MSTYLRPSLWSTSDFRKSLQMNYLQRFYKLFIRALFYKDPQQLANSSIEMHSHMQKLPVKIKNTYKFLP